MFLEALSKTPFAKEFRFVCVDPGPTGQRPPLPPYVKAVPTLMIKGESEPRTDNQVMNWLSERRVMTEGRAAGPMPPGAAAGINAGLSGMSDGLMAYGGEMAGIGDEGWAFIGEDTANAGGQATRLTSGMVSLDNLDKIMAPDIQPTGAMMAAAGVPGGPGGQRQTAKAKAFEDALAAYSASRDADLKRGGPGGGPGGAGPAGFRR
jgi:hypothetical protein